VPSRRKPPSESGTVIIPEPFAAPAIIHGEHVGAVDLRYDQAVKKAEKIGADAVPGVWLDNERATKIAALLEKEGSDQGRELAAEIVKAQTVLEDVK
jgi:hypothetical protein